MIANVSLALLVFIISLVAYILSLIVAEPSRARLRDLAFYLVLCAVFLLGGRS